MRSIVWLLLVAIAVAEVVDEPWYEEEDVDESYDDDDASYRKKREVYDPNIDHHRVKRCCEYEKSRKRRSPAVRAPRQVHHYEVHEFTDERLGPASPPYEEMLAASADHYQRYAVPPKSARYLDHSVNHVSGAHVPLKAAQINLSPSESVQFVPIATDPITVVNVDGPAPIHSGPLTQSPKKLDGGDLYGAAAGNHHKHTHGHGHTQGGGHANLGNHHAEHGGKTTKGFSTDHFVDKGGKGYKTDEHHRKEYEDAGGNKKKHHDHAGHQGSHEEEAHGSRGSHFGEKKGHKKGHKTKGKYLIEDYQLLGPIASLIPQNVLRVRSPFSTNSSYTTNGSMCNLAHRHSPLSFSPDLLSGSRFRSGNRFSDASALASKFSQVEPVSSPTRQGVSGIVP